MLNTYFLNFEKSKYLKNLFLNVRQAGVENQPKLKGLHS